MISYIKIYGPPVLQAIRALEKMAIDMPEVCIMDTIIHTNIPHDPEDMVDYFSYIGVGQIPRERCDKLISKSGEKMGEYDFFFEWFKDPSQKELNELLEKVDKTLAPLGCRYTITTK